MYHLEWERAHLSRVLEELVEVLPRRPRPQAQAVLRGVLRAPDGGLAVRGQRHGDLCRRKQTGILEEDVHTYKKISSNRPTWPRKLLRPLQGKVAYAQVLSKILLGEVVAVVDVKSGTRDTSS